MLNYGEGSVNRDVLTNLNQSMIVTHCCCADLSIKVTAAAAHIVSKLVFSYA